MLEKVSVCEAEILLPHPGCGDEQTAADGGRWWGRGAQCVSVAGVQIGLRLMAQAGYDIHGAPEVWDDFDRQASTPGGAAALLSTHPSNATRKAALHKEVASMKALGWRKGYVPPASLEMSAAGRGYFAL